MLINIAKSVPNEVPNEARGKVGRSGAIMYYTYILRVKNGRFYIGYSANLKQRINEHNQGKVKATENLRPLKLVFYAAFNFKQKALQFEKYLKTNSGYAFRNKRLI